MLDQDLLLNIMETAYEKGHNDNVTLYEIMDELVDMLKPVVVQK